MTDVFQRHFRGVVIFLAVFCFASMALCGEENQNKISTRVIPKDFNGAYEFLEYIKYQIEPKGPFDLQSVPAWDVPKFVSFISVQGMEFSDVNGGLHGHRSVNQIKGSLSSRKGEVFMTFAHLASIYSEPYKQYSELTFSRKRSEYVVNVADWYRLTFVSEGGHLRLRKCDYLQPEGD
jgi:hypothetical protein